MQMRARAVSPSIFIVRRSFRPHAHEGLTAAFGHKHGVLIEGAVMEFDDAGAWTRLRLALREDFRRSVHGIAFEQRGRELDLRHSEIGNRGSNAEI
jgi:hypothetical protein